MDFLAYKRHIKSIATYFSAALIPMLVNLAINPLIAKNMSPSEYAITGYFTAFNALVSPLVLFYLIHYYQKRYFEIDEGQRIKLKAIIFKSLLYFSFLIATICFVLIFVYLKWIDTDFSLPIFPYLAMTVFTVFLNGLYSLQTSDYKMQRKVNDFTRLSIFTGLSTSAVTLIFVVAIKWGAFGKLLAPLLCHLIVFVYVVCENKSLFRYKFSIIEYIKIIKFCVPLALGAMFGYFTSGFDKTYLEGIGNIEEYGVYIVGAQIGAYLNVFSTAISNTFSPDICETIATGNGSKFKKICLMQIALISVIVIGFVLLCPIVVNILTAGRYVQSAPYAAIISVSSITSSIYYIINYYSIATDRPKLYLYTTIIGTLAIIALYKPMVGLFNFIGGAIMVVLSYIILTVINIVLLCLVKK